MATQRELRSIQRKVLKAAKNLEGYPEKNRSRDVRTQLETEATSPYLIDFFVHGVFKAVDWGVLGVSAGSYLTGITDFKESMVRLPSTTLRPLQTPIEERGGFRRTPPPTLRDREGSEPLCVDLRYPGIPCQETPHAHPSGDRGPVAEPPPGDSSVAPEEVSRTPLCGLNPRRKLARAYQCIAFSLG